MAIYHLSVKPISRAGGRSATAAAAYRSGELVHDLTSDEVFDYTRKRGVEHSEIVLPTAAARADINWARDREARVKNGTPSTQPIRGPELRGPAGAQASIF